MKAAFGTHTPTHTPPWCQRGPSFFFEVPLSLSHLCFMEVIIIDSKAFKKLKEDLFEEFKQVLIEAKKETLDQLAMESDWVNTTEAKK